MNKILKRAYEATLGKLAGKLAAGILLNATPSYYRETPKVGFAEILEAYEKDPSCKAFVDFLADQAVGMGFYTTANSEYVYAEEAKRVVDEFNENVNMDSLLQQAAREVVACGNSFWLKIDRERLRDLVILPLTEIKGIKRFKIEPVGVEHGVEYYVYGVQQKRLNPKYVIHFRWNPVNNSPFGTGILQVLLQTLTISGEKRMSFLEMKARIERVLPEIFEKYAGPDELWIFPDVTPEKLNEFRALIRSKPKSGARFVYDKPNADIKTVRVDPRARFEAYMEHILNQVYLGGQTPLPKLFTTPGFTEASARAALEIAERKIMALQRFIARVVEREIFRLIVAQEGLNPNEAGVRLRWGQPSTPTIKVSDMLRAFELGVISRDELRNMLQKSGWELHTETAST